MGRRKKRLGIVGDQTRGKDINKVLTICFPQYIIHRKKKQKPRKVSRIKTSLKNLIPRDYLKNQKHPLRVQIGTNSW